MGRNEQYSVEYLKLWNRDFEVEDFYKGVKEAKLTVAKCENWDSEKVKKTTPSIMYSIAQGTDFDVLLKGSKLVEKFSLTSDQFGNIKNIIKSVHTYASGGTRSLDAVVHDLTFNIDEIKKLCISNGIYTIEYDFYNKKYIINSDDGLFDPKVVDL
ncbi:hypothetical protein [Lactiplantibacillus plantarum]|uniref:hypothetical protein n=1 Tax=Lactiplantibacillus plantarum TaxID=1590 RepID=UPI001BA508CD|nr:hypothetical protein [Lactiplantibacillus plantarum]MBS0935725.1 hypothetical protein [Lactiplantibacillus plantarum]MBS0943918.1 hypothetical protein [Lactiplantibacillus plantarum]